MNFVCKICGKNFEGKSWNNKFCSDKCRKIKRSQYCLNLYKRKKDIIRKKSKEYRIKNKEKIKIYLKKNREKRATKKKEWTIKNKNNIKEYNKKVYIKNQEINKENAIKYRLLNIDRAREIGREWVEKNRDHKNMLNNLRRKKEIKLKGFKDKIECFRKKMSEIGECIYCGSKENITIEHLIPISKGGTHEVYNLFPACRKCNSSKHAQDWIEWYRKQIFYSKDKENKILKMCC